MAEAARQVRKLLDNEINALAEELARCGSVSQQERGSVLRRHQERTLEISKMAGNALPSKLATVIDKPTGEAERTARDELHAVFSQHTEEVYRLAIRAGLEEEYNLLAVRWLEEYGTSNIGSGVGGQPLARVPCANVHPGNGRICENSGASACAECHLVSYCGRACQREH
jgi:hypothetical protein